MGKIILGHVALYPIKWKYESSHMVANILPADTLPHNDPGVKRSKFNLFRTWSCYLSEIKRDFPMEFPFFDRKTQIWT